MIASVKSYGYLQSANFWSITLRGQGEFQSRRDYLGLVVHYWELNVIVVS